MEVLADRRIFHKPLRDRLREYAPVLSLAATFCIVLAGLHAMFVRLTLASAVTQALMVHEATPTAHGPVRALYPSPREHDRVDQVINQLALSVEQIKNETREEHARMAATQAEQSKDIARILTSLKARGLGVNAPRARQYPAVVVSSSGR